MMSILVLASALAVPAVSPPPPAAYELAVKGAGSRGNLVFTAEDVAFDAADPKKSRRWLYRDLKQIRVTSPHEIAFDTFEDGSRWRFGADRTLEFDVVEGTIDGGLIGFLLQNVRRPISSAVLPAGLGEATVRVAAKHLRGRKGTHGAIAVYASGLAYESADAKGSRYWRFSDMQSIQRSSGYRLLIDVYEHGSIRAFAFELKEPLPESAFDDVWQRVNTPAERSGGDDESIRAGR